MRRINTGDVVAVAIDGVRCPPVGHVSDCDDDAISIDLYSWSACRFSAGEMLIRRRDIRATLWSRPMTHDEMRDAGINAYDGETVWHMDPLGDFQTRWKVG
jgi:hypothetical protein